MCGPLPLTSTFFAPGRASGTPLSIHPTPPHAASHHCPYTFHTKEKNSQSFCLFASYSGTNALNVLMSDRQTLHHKVSLCALYKTPHQVIVTAQHSLFLWGQTGCDVYVTCTASWPRHAPGPRVWAAQISPFTIKKYSIRTIIICGTFLQCIQKTRTCANCSWLLIRNGWY